MYAREANLTIADTDKWIHGAGMGGNPRTRSRLSIAAMLRHKAAEGSDDGLRERIRELARERLRFGHHG